MSAKSKGGNKKNNRSSVSTTYGKDVAIQGGAGYTLATSGEGNSVNISSSDPAVIAAALQTVNYTVNQSVTAVDTAAQALRDASAFQSSLVNNLTASAGDNIHAALTGVDALANKSLDATPAGTASVTDTTVKYALIAAAVIAAALLWASVRK